MNSEQLPKVNGRSFTSTSNIGSTKKIETVQSGGAARNTNGKILAMLLLDILLLDLSEIV